jgi:hypothetical protein
MGDAPGNKGVLEAHRSVGSTWGHRCLAATAASSDVSCGLRRQWGCGAAVQSRKKGGVRMRLTGRGGGGDVFDENLR